MAYKCIIPWVMMAQCFILVNNINAGKVPAIIVFGDSSVDSGNNNHVRTIVKANFPPYGRDFPGGNPTGRFCNGRIPPDFISEAFGLKKIVPPYLHPSYDIKEFATGVCFASAGTGYDPATSNILKTVPLSKEVDNYKEYQKKLRAHLGEKKANEVISEALYVISMGTNDFLENYYLHPITRGKYSNSVDKYIDFLVGIAEKFVKELHSLGARKISLGGLLPMGCLPMQRTKNIVGGKGDKCVDDLNTVSKNFNSKLSNTVQKLNKELSGIKLVYANVYDLFYEYIHNSSKYGFQDGGKACCATGRFELGYLCNKISPFTCKDAKKFVFWDAFHPSEETNRIISDALVKNGLRQFL
ncbi:GDSL esterase/lipase At2g04570-like [Cornus florida]|uniref:GDSL esterase/lipase At2g04570-like n=1 Tax=Cornus florida TaxID=4283 RepID=UPI0028992FF2|nr:GDSL esterase/lipase At2g04570-like [Cornus florida]